MLNYKGIFFNKEKEKKYYEGGAHFKYSDLVNALNTLSKEINKNTSIINKTINPNSIQNHKYINSEGNNYKNTIIKKKQNNSNLLTLNNYKDTLSNKNNLELTLDNDVNRKRLKKIQLLKPLDENHKISNLIRKEFNTLNICEKSTKSKSLFSKNRKNITKENNINDKLNINKNLMIRNLPLIESVYFNKLLNKNNIELNKEISSNSSNKTKIIKLFKSKVFSPITKNINYRNSIFPFKKSDTYNNKNFDTINILSKRRNYNFGKRFKAYNMNNNKK